LSSHIREVNGEREKRVERKRRIRIHVYSNPSLLWRASFVKGSREKKVCCPFPFGEKERIQDRNRDSIKKLKNIRAEKILKNIDLVNSKFPETISLKSIQSVTKNHP